MTKPKRPKQKPALTDPPSIPQDPTPRKPVEDGSEVPHPVYRWYWERDKGGKIIPESEIYERIK